MNWKSKINYDNKCNVNINIMKNMSCSIENEQNIHTSEWDGIEVKALKVL